MDIIYRHKIDQSISLNYFSVHTHNCYEIFFMTRGVGSFVVEGHEYKIAPDSMVILRPGEMHRAQIESGFIYERSYLHFYEDTIINIDPEGKLLRPFNDRLLGKSNFYSSEKIDTAFVKSLLLKAEKAIDQNPNDKDGLVHYLYIILKEIYDGFLAENYNTEYLHDYDKQIYKIIQYINSNICEKLSVCEIEKLFFISRPILNKRFKHATGTTVWDYIVTKRIILADKMISKGESATQAAYACGYNDYSSFYRAYYKIFNRPPKNYQR